jgi:hypothetical protein
VIPRLNVEPGGIGLVIVAQLFTVGAVQVTTFAHSEAVNETLMFVGHPEMTGAVLSVTVTLKVHVAVFPAASVAVYVTALVPRLNEVPGGVRVEIVAQPFAVGAVQVTTFEHSEAVNETLMLEGHPDITGAVLSVTVTLKVHVAVFPAASVAVYVTAVVPRLNDVPDGVRVEIVAQPFAVGGVQVTTLAHSEAVNETLMLEGHPEMTGAVLSVTITLNVHLDVLPAASVAV